ncbi:MAG: hypothetical protein GXY52_06485 [Chloroflexi bacterium]|nr:hypothetical protein [Chloroflexota bacterium]
MFKKQSLFLVVLIALAVVLGSCSFTPGQMDAPPVSDDTTGGGGEEVVDEEVEPTATPTELTQKGIVAIINLWYDWSGENEAVLNDVLAKFKEEYPNVIINTTYVPDSELKEKFEKDSRTPYLIIGPPDWAKEWMDIYFIQDLSLMAEAETGWMDTWTEEALATSTVDGALLTTPINAGMAGVDKPSVFYLPDAANYQNKTAAWEMMMFFTRPEIQEMLVAAGQKTILKGS